MQEFAASFQLLVPLVASAFQKPSPTWDSSVQQCLFAPEIPSGVAEALSLTDLFLVPLPLPSLVGVTPH